jgi:hypothetical protein
MFPRLLRWLLVVVAALAPTSTVVATAAPETYGYDGLSKNVQGHGPSDPLLASRSATQAPELLALPHADLATEERVVLNFGRKAAALCHRSFHVSQMYQSARDQPVPASVSQSTTMPSSRTNRNSPTPGEPPNHFLQAGGRGFEPHRLHWWDHPLWRRLGHYLAESACVSSGVCRARAAKSASAWSTGAFDRMATAAIRQSMSLRTVSPLRWHVR